MIKRVIKKTDNQINSGNRQSKNNMFLKILLALALLFIVGCGVYYFFENKNGGNWFNYSNVNQPVHDNKTQDSWEKYSAEMDERLKTEREARLADEKSRNNETHYSEEDYIPKSWVPVYIDGFDSGRLHLDILDISREFSAMFNLDPNLKGVNVVDLSYEHNSDINAYWYRFPIIEGDYDLNNYGSVIGDVFSFNLRMDVPVYFVYKKNGKLSSKLALTLVKGNYRMTVDLLSKNSKIEFVVVKKLYKETEEWNKKQETENDEYTSSSQQMNDQILTIDTFSTFPDEIKGCSCYFSNNKTEFEKEQYIFMCDYLGQISFLKINGVLTRFTIIENLAEGDALSGDFKAKFKSDDYELEVEFHATGEHGYESSMAKGTIKLMDKNGKTIVKTMYGLCGC